MLNDTKTQARVDRHHITQEDFTPDEVVKMMYSRFPEDIYTDFSKTVLDPCCGIGNLLLFAVTSRLTHCKTSDDIYDALSTIYGTELMQDNVDECKSHISDAVAARAAELNISLSSDRLNEILNHNIVCTDTFNWNYELWCEYTQSLFD